MRFNPYAWDEVSSNEEIEVGKGRVLVRCSAPTPLYVSAQGVEALAGVGTSHDVEVSEAVTIRLDAAKGVRCFVHRGGNVAVRPVGEVFTNIDNMPVDDGAVAAIKKAMREFDLRKLETMQEMRRQHERQLAAMRDAAAQPPSEPLEAVPVVEGAGGDE